MLGFVPLQQYQELQQHVSSLDQKLKDHEKLLQMVLSQMHMGIMDDNPLIDKKEDKDEKMKKEKMRMEQMRITRIHGLISV